MTLKALEAIAAELREQGVEISFTKNHSREKRAKMILAGYNELDLKADGRGSNSPSPSEGPLSLSEPKPLFERLIDGETEAAPQDVQGPQRGGLRPGAGRPEGMTDELATYQRLSKQPHPVVKDIIEKIFDKWSERVGCPAVKLTKDQAVALALPWTHAYELSPIGGKIPPWMSVAFMCIWTSYSIAGEKFTIAREHLKKRKQQVAQAAAEGSLN